MLAEIFAPEQDDWRCAGCGIPSPNTERACDCPTRVVCRGVNEQAWKREPGSSVEVADAIDALLAFRHGDTKQLTPEHARLLFEIFVDGELIKMEPK